MPSDEGRISVRWNARDIGLLLLTFVVIVALWEGIVRAFNISDNIFPTASDVGLYLFSNIVDGTFLSHFKVTFIETIGGFVIGSLGAIVLGVLVSEIRWINNLIYPYILATQAVPKVALAPLFLIWFGFGISSKIALAVTMVFFPVLVNTVTGLQNANESQIKLLQAYSASRWQILRRVKLPGSLPYIFAGLEIAIVLSIVAAVVSEFVGANAGLGYLIIIYNNQLNMAGQFSVLILLGVVGMALSALIQGISRKIVFWQ
ncbi:ABC transporter permease [Virgibacillus byunsanensis]|uniref:ABC transporter permease n=1 Tax=Virgibacillus byunsanensis TaxID=570945 RepID=A0ABW3LM10_9BACI